MKTTATKQQQTETVQPKANKQAGTQQILQRYKQQTAQLQATEEEDLLQGKFETVQRMGIEEDEPLQGKFATTQLAAEEDVITTKPNNTGLPDKLKSGIENLSGYSMDDVKVHYNSDKPAQLQAHAYAQGTDIHIAPGQEKHLPHEAWHVVQQKQGRVKPTMQMKGTVPVNDDAGLEKEADVMGDKALTELSVSYKLSTLNKKESPLIQYKKSSDKIVVQRNAFWSLDNESNIPKIPFAINVEPNGRNIERQGGSINHRIYHNASAAKSAAKHDLKLDSFKSYTVKGGTGAGEGIYIFFPRIIGKPEDNLFETKVLVNHINDPEARLNVNGNVRQNINHFHAGIIKGKFITDKSDKPCEINYERFDNAAEHYYDASTF